MFGIFLNHFIYDAMLSNLFAIRIWSAMSAAITVAQNNAK